VQRTGTGDLQLFLPEHCVAEVLSVVVREHGAGLALDAWRLMRDVGSQIVALRDDVVEESLVQCDLLRCSLYDSFAPGLASLLDATLITADRKAHAGFPRVQFIG